MNKVILMGRITRDAEIRYTQGEKSTAIARFSLAVERRFKRDNDEQQNTDFIAASHSEKSLNFWKSSDAKEQNLLWTVVFRLAVTTIRKDRKCTPQTLLWKTLNLLRVKTVQVQVALPISLLLLLLLLPLVMDL